VNLDGERGGGRAHANIRPRDKGRSVDIGGGDRGRSLKVTSQVFVVVLPGRDALVWKDRQQRTLGFGRPRVMLYFGDVSRDDNVEVPLGFFESRNGLVDLEATETAAVDVDDLVADAEASVPEKKD
jgi:hypothetical protein